VSNASIPNLKDKQIDTFLTPQRCVKQTRMARILSRVAFDFKQLRVRIDSIYRALFFFHEIYSESRGTFPVVS